MKDTNLRLIFTIRPFDPWSDILCYELSSLPFEGFEYHKDKLDAFIAHSDLDLGKVDEICRDLGKAVDLSYTVEEVPSKNWNELWESNYDDLVISDTVHIRAHFHSHRPEFPVEIILHPKMSFGTGHHETTQLMMEAMLDLNFSGKSVLDVGCGTGILSILAEKSDALAINAIDIDEWAVANATENAEINNCLKISVEKQPITGVNKTGYNIILANINLNTIIGDMGEYSMKLTDKGMLLLSGFLMDEVDTVQKRALQCALTAVAINRKGNWGFIQLQKSRK